MLVLRGKNICKRQNSLQEQFAVEKWILHQELIELAELPEYVLCIERAERRRALILEDICKI